MVAPVPPPAAWDPRAAVAVYAGLEGFRETRTLSNAQMAGLKCSEIIFEILKS